MDSSRTSFARFGRNYFPHRHRRDAAANRALLPLSADGEPALSVTSLFPAASLAATVVIIACDRPENGVNQYITNVLTLVIAIVRLNATVIVIKQRRRNRLIRRDNGAA
jgi:hypothetical protein